MQSHQCSECLIYLRFHGHKIFSVYKFGLLKFYTSRNLVQFRNHVPQLVNVMVLFAIFLLSLAQLFTQFQILLSESLLSQFYLLDATRQQFCLFNGSFSVFSLSQKLFHQIFRKTRVPSSLSLHSQRQSCNGNLANFEIILEGVDLRYESFNSGLFLFYSPFKSIYVSGNFFSQVVHCSVQSSLLGVVLLEMSHHRLYLFKYHWFWVRISPELLFI